MRQIPHRAFLLAGLFTIAAVGCELAMDFDRTKIPGVDASFDDDASDQDAPGDVAVQDSASDTGADVTTDSGVDVATDTRTDGPPPDVATDTGTDTGPADTGATDADAGD
jgi:hypothetical protein